ETLQNITRLLDVLIPASVSVGCFGSRWKIIGSRLASLKSLIAEISDSAHWSENPLLVPILPEALSTLSRVEMLCRYCYDDSAISRGKLLMQSDLDMASGWLSKHINDLDLLLRSGVLQKSTAIVLSRPEASSSKEEIGFFIKDLFTRLQIGCLDFKKEALNSLIELLLEDKKSAFLVAHEGNLGCLIQLLDPNADFSIRELSVATVSLLASAGDLPRKCVFNEGALGPLLRIIDSGSMPMKEKAAMAVEFITSDPDNAWAISAYGGIPIMIQLCKSGSLVAQSHAVGVVRNIATTEDVRMDLAEEGIVPVLMQLLNSGSPLVQGKAANCVSILASTNDHFSGLLQQAKCLQRLLQSFEECSVSDTLEQILRAIYSLSSSDSCYRILSGSTPFILHLAELVKHGSLILQHLSASLLANLAISDANKRGISSCMASLVKLMECLKPDGMQEVAAKALISLLSLKSNRKELVKDEKSLMRLVQMLNPMNEIVSKKYPIAIVTAVMAGGSQGCRTRLVSAGACNHMQRLAEMDIPGAKKALQRLSTNRLSSMLSWAW
ncbi:hypothetical protein M569_12537, partial [Genlisea aurea]